MAHVRKQVRKAIATILDGSVAGLWSYVFETRRQPTRDVYNYLMVYWDTEVSENETIHPAPFLDRSVAMVTRAVIKITDDETVEDQADAIAAEIETLLTTSALNTALSGQLKDLQLQSTTFSDETDETERTAAILSLEWLVRVMTIEGQPETLI